MSTQRGALATSLSDAADSLLPIMWPRQSRSVGGTGRRQTLLPFGKPSRTPMLQNRCSGLGLPGVCTSFAGGRRGRCRNVFAAFSFFPKITPPLYCGTRPPLTRFRVSHPQGVSSWPEPGSQFLQFDLISEIGRGSFGRVFLPLNRL